MGYSGVLLGIRLFPNVMLKAARVSLIFRLLEKCGEIIKAVPSVIELEEERFGSLFQLVVVTRSSPEELRELILSVSEIKDSVDVLTMLVSKDQIQTLDHEGKIIDLPLAAPSPAVAEPEEDPLPENTTVYTRSTHTVKAPAQLRVDPARLEQLLYLVDELVLCRAQLSQNYRHQHYAQMQTPLHTLEGIASALHSLSIQLQMVPIEQVFNRFPRMIRDLGKSLGKYIELQLEGRDLEMDRTLVEDLSNALVHMLRNAADHGLEPPDERLAQGKPTRGLIVLSARYERDMLCIDVRDDGRGVDTDKLRRKALERGLITREQAAAMSPEEALKLVFMPGLSTQDTATDISGRGVGMDAVRTQIENLGGTIAIHSRRGSGTHYALRIQSGINLLTALLVGVQGDFFAIDIAQIRQVSELSRSETNAIQQGQTHLLFEEEPLPLLILSEALDPGHKIPGEQADFWLIVVAVEGQKIGLLVDELLGREEIITKPLQKKMQSSERGLFSGATVLENGEVALLLDLSQLLHKTQWSHSF